MLGYSICRGPLSAMGCLLLPLWGSLIVTATAFGRVSSKIEPHFAEPIKNVTVTVDRRATLTCIVDDLGGSRIAWIKADSQTLLTVHTHVITHNSRISTSHNGLRQWNLHIDNVKESDRGEYMCQINTSPMKSQVGYIDIVVPPDILWDETSSDVSVNEGQGVSLTCKATGYPKPTITWRREDGEFIVLRVAPKEKIRVQSINTDTLNISRVHRRHMAVYLCIASNGIPPSVSKRVKLQVNFEPIVRVPMQMVGAPVGAEVRLECTVEVAPKSANYWTRDTGEMLISGPKYRVTELESSYRVTMILTILAVEHRDFGTYNCVSRNSLGEAQGSIRLRELDLPSTSTKVEIEEKYGGRGFSQNDSHSSHKTIESTENSLTIGLTANHSFQGRKYELAVRNASSDLTKDLLEERELGNLTAGSAMYHPFRAAHLLLLLLLLFRNHWI